MQDPEGRATAVTRRTLFQASLMGCAGVWNLPSAAGTSATPPASLVQAWRDRVTRQRLHAALHGFLDELHRDADVCPSDWPASESCYSYWRLHAVREVERAIGDLHRSRDFEDLWYVALVAPLLWIGSSLPLEWRRDGFFGEIWRIYRSTGGRRRMAPSFL